MSSGVCYGQTITSGTYTLHPWSTSEDYNSWASFWADIDTSTLTGDVILKVYPGKYDEGTTEPAQVYTALAGYTIWIRPYDYPNGFPSTTDGRSGAVFELGYDATQEFLHLSVTGAGTVIIEGISVIVTSGSTSPANIIYNNAMTGSTQTVIVRRCIFINEAASPADGIAYYSPNTPNHQVYNNVLIGFRDGIVNWGQTPASDSYISHNTVVNSTRYGISGADKACLYENNLVDNSTTSDYYNVDLNATGYNNLSEDATADDFAIGANNVINATITFTSSANNEYYLDSTDTDAINAGKVVASDHLVARYRFERGALTTDDSANTNTVTSHGTPSSVYDCKEGYGAVELNGSTDYYDLANGSLSADFPGKAAASNPDLTVCFLMNPDANDYASCVAKWKDDGDEGWMVFQYSDEIRFYKGWNSGNDSETTTTAINMTFDGSHWYFVAVRYDESADLGTARAVKIKVYDLSTSEWLADTTATHSNNMDNNCVAPLHIGVHYNNAWALIDYFDGKLDDIQIFDRALDDWEIKRVMREATDVFSRPRAASPDIGAFEYIASRDFYIENTAGSNSDDGDSHTDAWNDFTNLDNRILNPGDRVLLDSDEWDDTLNLKAIGCRDDEVIIKTCVGDVTDDTNCEGGADANIDTSSGDGISILNSAWVDVSDIDIEDCENDGIYIYNSSWIDLNDLDIVRNGDIDAADSWAYGDHGVYLYFCDGIDITDCDISSNAKDGLLIDAVKNMYITGCTINKNGMVGSYEWSMGLSLNNTSDGCAANNDSITVDNTTFSRNSRRGSDVSPNGLFENNVVEYNGDGWCPQGVVVFGESSSTGSIADGVVVTQATSNAGGTVHHWKSAHHTKNGTTNWLSVYPDVDFNSTATTGTAGTTLVDSTAPFLSSHVGARIVNIGDGTLYRWTTIAAYTSSTQATLTADIYIDDTDAYTIYDEFDATNVISGTGGTWTPSSMKDYGGQDGYSSSGLDCIRADNAVVRNNNIGYTFKVPGVAFDAYGINVDKEADNMYVYYNVIYSCSGAGITFNDNGKNTLNKAYHNFIYSCNTLNSKGGINVEATVEGAEIKNNIVLNEGYRALYVRSGAKGLIIDNNCYYISPGGTTELIRYESTDYNHNEFSNYQAAIADESLCTAADTPFDCCTGAGTGTCTEEANSIAVDPKVTDPANGNYLLESDSPCIDEGANLSSYFDGTPPYIDYYGNTVPVDGDQSVSAIPDIGHHEYSIGFVWGKSSDDAGYHNDGWTEATWDTDGSGGEILTDSQTGKLSMDDNEYFLGPVKDLGSTATRYLELSHTNITGTGTICWRGQATVFTQTATDPSWTAYSAGENKDWRYIQIGTSNSADCSLLP